MTDAQNIKLYTLVQMAHIKWSTQNFEILVRVE